MRATIFGASRVKYSLGCSPSQTKMGCGNQFEGRIFVFQLTQCVTEFEEYFCVPHTELLDIRYTRNTEQTPYTRVNMSKAKVKFRYVFHSLK